MSCANMTFVFSGFRDDTLKTQIESQGGKVSATLTKSVTHLIAKKEAKPSKKLEEAKEKDVEIVFLEDFLEEHDFKEGEKKPRGRKPKKVSEDGEAKSEPEPEAAEPNIKPESDMALLCKILVALSTGEDKKSAIAALDEIKSRLSA